MIQERKQRLLRLAERHAFTLRQSYVGQKRWVLFEKDTDSESGWISGHTDNFLPVMVANEGFLRANALVEIELISNQPDTLLGKIIS